MSENDESPEGQPGRKENVQSAPDYELEQYFPSQSIFSREDKDHLRAEFGHLRTFFILRPERFRNLQEWLNQGRFGTTFDAYLARATYYALGASLVGLLLGLAGGVVIDQFNLLAGASSPVAVPRALLPVAEAIAEFRVIIATIALSIVSVLVLGGGTWAMMYYYPRSVVNTRKRNINVFLPHALVYMYALSSGGRNVVEVTGEIADADDVYGAVSEEFDTIVRDVELFGNDLFTAIRNARNLTPSESLEQFLDDMLNVLDSGSDFTTFLEEESQRYMEEAKEEQEHFLETLELLSEVFVAGFVAAPLFLIVTLMVISLLGGQTLLQTYALVYVVLPLGMLGFILLIDYLSQPFVQPRRTLTIDDGTDIEESLADESDRDSFVRYFTNRLSRQDRKQARRGSAQADGGTVQVPLEADPRFHRFRRSHRLRRIGDILRKPIEWIAQNPAVYTLFLTVPIALAYLVAVFWTGVLDPTIEAYNAQPTQVTILLAVVPFLILSVPLSLLYELKRRREKQLVDRFPNILNILSSANQMGIPLTDALMLVSRWSRGVMSEELRKVKNDITWNYDVRRALIRMANRLRVPQITQTMKLIAEGSYSSSDLSKIISIAAQDSRNRRKLEKKRQTELSSYIAIVVIGFLVYLAVIVLLDSSYLDPIAELGETASGTGAAGGGLTAIGEVPVQAYRTVFFHSALIQGVGTGMLAGKLSDNSILTGLKYSIVLVAISVVVFILI